MKILKKILLLAILMVLAPATMNAQQKFQVHEDVVKPSMTAEYEAVLKEMGELIKEYPLEGVNMLVLRNNNNHYYYVSPISSMADLDKQTPIAQLYEKAGSEKVGKLLTRLDKCYDIEKDYIITLDADLSYMPNGLTQTPAGENYREHYKIYIAPENRDAVKEKMKAIKNLYVDKGSKLHYRVYKSGFGTESEYYMVSVAAKDEADMAAKATANDNLLGDERKKMMLELFENVLRIEELEGEIRPDLGVQSN